MRLPVRVLREVSAEPVIAVDGAWGAPGLNLSHWPGNTTPAALRHELSTGSALAFARLGAREREDFAAGAVAIANNHYDTDGICALWSVARPADALPRAGLLLDAAAAGDFFRIPTEDALAVDAIVGGLGSPGSPLAAGLAGLDDLARWQRQTDHLMEQLGAILDGDRGAYRALWEPVLEDARADRADLARSRRRDRPELDLTVWTAPAGLASSRPHAPVNGFDPGRHALQGGTPRDRVLVLAERDGGTCCRLIFGTRSWFDLPGVRPRPRPDLDALAARLNALGGTDPDGPAAWRAQPATGASPELWFGAAELESFAEHSGALRPCGTSAAAIEDTIATALSVASTSTSKSPIVSHPRR